MGFFDFYLFSFVFMIFSGFFVFCSVRKHLLLTLLSLEFIALSLYFLFFVFLSFFSMSYYFLLIFLTFSVCEAVAGLGVLVTLIRGHGNDNIASFSVLLW